MKTPINPFITNGYLSPEYFCDREVESKEIIRSMVNGDNLALMSPRRLGKSGLIHHCFQNKQIKDKYNTFYVDIYAAGSLREFVYFLGKEIFESLKPEGNKIIDGFFTIISSLRPAFRLDERTGSPSFEIGLGDIKQPEFTLEQIFYYLETADKPSIVAIDEFQQISKFPESNIEAILRTHIQKCKNCHFIFAGSHRNMMQAIFASPARPFYQSVGFLTLGAIEKDVYVDFIVSKFQQYERTISSEYASLVYNLFDGHTWYIQKCCNYIFSQLNVNEECTTTIFESSIEQTIASYENIFKGILSMLPEKQKELLIAISKEKNAKNITSAAFIHKHSLASASSVQAATKQLLDKQLVTFDDLSYSVYDRFMGLWLQKSYGSGYRLNN